MLKTKLVIEEDELRLVRNALIKASSVLRLYGTRAVEAKWHLEAGYFKNAHTIVEKALDILPTPENEELPRIRVPFPRQSKNSETPQ